MTPIRQYNHQVSKKNVLFKNSERQNLNKGNNCVINRQTTHQFINYFIQTSSFVNLCRAFFLYKFQIKSFCRKDGLNFSIPAFLCGDDMDNNDDFKFWLQEISEFNLFVKLSDSGHLYAMRKSLTAPVTMLNVPDMLKVKPESLMKSNLHTAQ